MGFYNIYTEGQQAEEYKKKKADAERFENQFGHSMEHHNRYYGRDFGGKKAEKGYSSGGSYTKTDKDGIDHDYGTAYIGSKNTEERYVPWDRKKPEEGGFVTHSPSNEDLDRNAAARRVSSRSRGNPDWEEGFGYNRVDADAINRHMRRHPDQWDGDKRIKTRSESGIFESIEFLND